MSAMDEALRGLSRQLFELIAPQRAHGIEPATIPGKTKDSIIAGDILVEGEHSAVVAKVIYSCLKHCSETIVRKSNGLGRTTTVSYSFPNQKRMGEALEHIHNFSQLLANNDLVKKNVLTAMQTSELVDSLGATNSVPQINLRFGMPEIGLRINTVDRALAVKLKQALGADFRLTPVHEVWNDVNQRPHCGGFHCFMENNQIKDLAEVVNSYRQEARRDRGI